LLRSRTKDDAGRELGAWTDATRPTLVDVEQLIALAAGQTTDADGPASTSCSSLCRNVIALHAACLVELSYFPEQVRSERSPYSELRELLVDARAAFDTCRAAGSPDDPGAGAGYGYHSLPTTPLTTYNAYGGDAAHRGLATPRATRDVAAAADAAEHSAARAHRRPGARAGAADRHSHRTPEL
jgi:hypothetical protein